jgi:CheY-like chemotaxis protein
MNMATQEGYLLVVDDIPDILKLLDATLKFKGYRVVTARDGQEALETIQKERPALVVADILMPRMDGFNLVHRLRLDPETRDIPVVFLSATYVAQEDKDFALSIGVTRFIEKPVNLAEFLPVVEELMSQGNHATHKSLDEFEFYDGYRKRLEIKLHQKVTQIARDQHLLETLSDAEKPTFQATLQQAIRERDEIQLLLDQISDRLKGHTKAE